LGFSTNKPGTRISARFILKILKMPNNMLRKVEKGREREKKKKRCITRSLTTVRKCSLFSLRRFGKEFTTCTSEIFHKGTRIWCFCN
jgi:hypothetical protein